MEFKDAIPAESVEAEYARVRATSCACGGPFAGRSQTLRQDPASGKRYDEVLAVCAKCGASRTFLFDISSFFGKKREEEAPPRAERGCMLAAGLLALAALVAGVLVWRVNSPVLAFVLFGVAGVLAWLGWPRRARDEDMGRALERLGIPLGGDASDPRDALTGGAAKAILYRQLAALEARRWDDAAKNLTAALHLLSDPKWAKVKSVALRLRARAHEGAGRKADALADYDGALALAPDDAEARAGKARLS